MFLRSFRLLSEIQEHDVICFAEKRNIYTQAYPLGIFTAKEFRNITFEPITIFCGGNGSGKTTLLNIIAEKMHAKRKVDFDKGSYFRHYVKACEEEVTRDYPRDIKVITSDDVFDYLLDIRSINTDIDRRKERLSQEYMNAKYRDPNTAFETYEELKNTVDARRQTMSKYVREHLGNNTIAEYSNGESALAFWTREIDENSLYFLDEPENSLSAENQLKLKKFIEDSARFYHCQFVIATHSPFLLDLDYAKVYDLDEVPVVSKKWTDVKNVRIYYEFFKERKEEFER